MTDCTFTARIDGATIACTLTAGRAIAAPEAARPRLTTSTRAMMTTAGCPKPSKALFAGTTPMTTPAMRALNATTS